MAKADQKSSTERFGMPTADQLSKLLKQVTSIGKQTAELVGSLREKIAYAVDKQHLHKKAFAEFRKIVAMGPEKALEYQTHLNFYLDVSGEQKKIDDVGRLELGDQPGQGDAGEKEPAGAPAKVTALDAAREKKKTGDGKADAKEPAGAGATG